MHQLMFFGSPYALATSDLSGIILIGAIVLLVALPMLLRWGLSALIGAGSNAIRDASARNKNKQLEAKGLDTGLLIARYVGSNALPPELADIADKVARHQISEEEARAHIITKARSLGLYDTDGADSTWAQNRTIDCPRCGNTVPVGVKFCNKCGAEIPEDMPAAPALDTRQEAQTSSEETDDLPIICPHCGEKLPDGAKFCGSCGGLLIQPQEVCPSCNSPLPTDAKFCGTCGAALE